MPIPFQELDRRIAALERRSDALATLAEIFLRHAQWQSHELHELRARLGVNQPEAMPGEISPAMLAGDYGR